METIQQVHAPWKEQIVGDDVKWEFSRKHRYTFSNGGPKSGPTSLIQIVASTAKSLACIFLVLLPLSFFPIMEMMLKKYVYDDWVVGVIGTDRDGNRKIRHHFIDVTTSTNASPRRSKRMKRQMKKKDGSEKQDK